MASRATSDFNEDDLIAERIAIDIYRKMITWFGDGDPTTRRMLEDILEDEEDHADDLSDLLAKQSSQPKTQGH